MPPYEIKRRPRKHHKRTLLKFENSKPQVTDKSQVRKFFDECSYIINEESSRKYIDPSISEDHRSDKKFVSSHFDINQEFSNIYEERKVDPNNNMSSSFSMENQEIKIDNVAVFIGALGELNNDTYLNLPVNSNISLPPTPQKPKF